MHVIPLHACKERHFALHAGRSTERPVLSEEELERNVQGIRGILQRLLAGANGAGPAPAILNNLVCAFVVRMLSVSATRRTPIACKRAMQRRGVRRALPLVLL